MAKRVTSLQIFVASPSDVSDERLVVSEVVEDLNLSLSNSKIRFEVLKWETHTRPALGDGGQDVVNRQIGDNYDVLVGIMWTKYGTKTTRSKSGTEEEYNRAISRSRNGDSVEIMFYFKSSSPPDLDQLDVEQLEKVRQFKKRIRADGLQRDFSDTEDLRRKLHIDLMQFASHWQRKNVYEPASEMNGQESATQVARMTAAGHDSDSTSSSVAQREINPLSNLEALDEMGGLDHDEELGFVDLVEQTTLATENTRLITDRITDASKTLGRQFSLRVEELNKADINQNIKQRKRVINNSANDLEHFVNRLSIEIPELHVQQATALDALAGVVTSPEITSDEHSEVLGELHSTLNKYRDGLSSAKAGVKNLRQSVAGMPRLTKNFIRARRRTVAVVDDLLAQIERALGQIEDIEQLLEEL